MEMTERNPPVHSLSSTRILRNVLKDYYRALDHASGQGHPKIAWCTSQGPVELLRAMGFLVYFPENHGVLLGTTRRATEFIGAANAAGYSMDICSYVTSDIGAFLQGETPLADTYGVSGLPSPDVLVYNNNQCRDVQEWFGFYARQYKVPLLGIRAPRGVGEVTRDLVESVSGQMKKLAQDLARISGHSLDLGAFSATVALSRKMSDIWKRILETAVSTPAPITFTDVCFHIGPAVTLRGTDVAVQYYEGLLKEVEGRQRQGTGTLEQERLRVYWEGMPIWGRLRFLGETMAEMKTSLVASTYGHSWVFEALDPADPFSSTARAYTELFTVRDEPYKETFLRDMIERFRVDGVIYHNARTCPNCTNCHYGMPDRVRQKTGIPYLIIDGDLNDLRCFSQEQTLTNLEAFAEMLTQRS